MTDDNVGPEESNLLGDLTEDEARAFFESFCGWGCLRSNYDYIDENEERKRGIDILYDPFSPYIGSEFGVGVSVKFRSNEQYPNKFKKWIYTLKNKIENADDSSGVWSNTEELFDEDITILNRGILFMKLSEFDEEEYVDKLKDIEMNNLKRKNPVSINLLSNRRIMKFCEISQFFNNRDYEEVEFLYEFYGEHRDRSWDRRLSFSYLFSDIILGKGDEDKFAITFDEPTKENIDYLLDTCGEDGFHISPDILIFANTDGYNVHDVREAVERSKEKATINIQDFEVKLLQEDPESLENKDLGEIF